MTSHRCLELFSCIFLHMSLVKSVKVCSSIIWDRDKQRRVERCDTMFGGWGCWRIRIYHHMFAAYGVRCMPLTNMHEKNKYDYTMIPGQDRQIEPQPLMGMRSLIVVFGRFFTTWSKKFLDVGLIWTKKCKSRFHCGSKTNLNLSTRLELVV